jgi:hypothetical protein
MLQPVGQFPTRSRYRLRRFGRPDADIRPVARRGLAWVRRHEHSPFTRAYERLRQDPVWEFLEMDCGHNLMAAIPEQPPTSCFDSQYGRLPLRRSVLGSRCGGRLELATRHVSGLSRKRHSGRWLRSGGARFPAPSQHARRPPPSGRRPGARPYGVPRRCAPGTACRSGRG